MPVHVLSIKFYGDLCQIKAQFSYCQTTVARAYSLLRITTPKRSKRVYKLYNVLTINKQYWNCATVGIVDFFNPPGHAIEKHLGVKRSALNGYIREQLRLEADK